MSSIGRVIVTCPSCGASLDCPVWLNDVTVSRHRLHVKFQGVGIDHECKGRD